MAFIRGILVSIASAVGLRRSKPGRASVHWSQHDPDLRHRRSMR